MILQALRTTADVFRMSLDGADYGRFVDARNSMIEIHLSDGGHHGFLRRSWAGESMSLVDLDENRSLGTAERTALIAGSWNLQLGIGDARLGTTGFFASPYSLRRGPRIWAEVQLLRGEAGWIVHADESLIAVDLLLVGLVYHHAERRLWDL